MRRLAKLCLALLLSIAGTATAGTYQHIGVGGGGQLHGGAIHPTYPNYVVIGADCTGAYLSEDGGDTWTPYNRGLATSDEIATHYFTDAVGVSYDGEDFFVATTQGGIYRADLGQPWEPMTPAQDYWYGTTYSWGTQPFAIPFECIDWDGSSVLVAGAGRARFDDGINYELQRYPSPAVVAYAEPDTQSIWMLDLDDTSPTWTAMTGTSFGTVRDISVTTVNGLTRIAAVTSNGIWLWDSSSMQWSNLAGLQALAMTPGNGVAWEDMPYGTRMHGWSVHLTERGSLYIACSRDATESVLPAGVYRIHDVSAAPLSYWFYVGNTTPEPYFNAIMYTMGLVGSYHPDDPNLFIPAGQFAFMTVADGEGPLAPDIIYVGDPRYGLYGLFRGSCRYADVLNQGAWTNLVAHNGRIEPGVLTSAEDGWINDWGAHVLFQPIVAPGSADTVIVALNGRLHKSEDGGATWESVYTTGSPAGWTSTGYSELCVMDLGWWGDRMVEATADAGMFMSTDASLDALVEITPDVMMPYASASASQIWNQECIGIEIVDNWSATGRPAMFASFGDYQSRACASKIMMYHDADLSGETWTWIGASLANPERYLFHRFAVVGNKVYAPYLLYSAPITASVTSSESGTSGVKVFEYTGTGWTSSDYDTGLDGEFFSDITYCASSSRLFLTSHIRGTTYGGIWYRNVAVPGSSWVKCVGQGDAAVPTNQTTWGDVRCLGASSDGSVLYAGTRGRSGGSYGTVLKCSDTGATPPIWTPQFNMDAGTCVIDFSIPAHQDEINNWTALTANRTLATVASICVDPYDPSIYWFGLASDFNGAIAERSGIWKHSGSTFEKINEGEPFEGATVSAVSLAPDGRLVAGTYCLETWVSGNVEISDPRVTDGLVALYRFDEGNGALVHDSAAAGTPLNLTISDSTRVAWVQGGGLQIQQPVVITSSGSADKIDQACLASDEVTVEVWAQAANTTQNGPARYVAHSLNGYPDGGNFMLGQEYGGVQARIRSTSTDVYGYPALTGAGAVDTTLIHWVLSRDSAGSKVLYRDGSVIATGETGGTFGNWGEYSLTIANEPDGQRSWLGTMYLVAVYDRALSAAEVTRNLEAGHQTQAVSEGRGRDGRNIAEQAEKSGAAPIRRSRLEQNAPNPFNPVTTINFEIVEAGAVSLRIFDVSGRLVRTLFAGALDPGPQSMTWNGMDDQGRDVAGGVYLVQLVTGRDTATRKMLLVK